MAAPELDGTQSVLFAAQWAAYAFQPFANNSPESWACSTLPPGFEINEATGLISGAGTTPGVYRLDITATNGDGSGSAMYTIGIAAAAASNGAFLDITTDVITRQVGLTAALTPAASSAATAANLGTALPGSAANPNADPLPVVGLVKYGDSLMLNLTISKNGTVLDLPVTAIKVAMTDNDSDTPCVTGTQWVQVGSGSATSYLIFVPMSGPALQGEMQENNVVTDVTLIAAIQVTYTNPVYGDSVGTATLTFETDDFAIVVVQNLNAL